MQYSKERKEAVLKKMVPPHNRSIVEEAREEGISEATLYMWRRQVRERGLLLPDSDSAPEGSSGNIRNWHPVAEVWLNPPADADRKQTSARAV
ncbi:MAG: transposase [Deltaproteobacteria bacterium]|nr:transposase [Deltaproteobacteria bacterium]